MESLRLREGEAALGVWLPLALASISATIINALKGGEPVKMSTILASWALPTLAAAVREGEEDAQNAQTIAGFEALAQRFGIKAVDNGESNTSKDTR